MQAYRFNQNLEMCTKITNLALKLHHFVGSLSQICWDLAETITAICTNSSTTKSHFQGTSHCILPNYACTCLTFYSCPMKYGYTRSIAHKLISKAGQKESSWSTECCHWPVHEFKCPKFLSSTKEYQEAKGSRGNIIHSTLVFPMHHYVVFYDGYLSNLFLCIVPINCGSNLQLLQAHYEFPGEVSVSIFVIMHTATGYTL